MHEALDAQEVFLRITCKNVDIKWLKIRQNTNNRKQLNDFHTNVYTLDVYMLYVYNLSMIISFADKETEKVYHQIYSKKLPNSIQKVALRKLIMIDNAESIDDLKVPPGNRLEVLKGDRAGQYSIRINDQFRICFKMSGNRVSKVEIVDYH